MRKESDRFDIGPVVRIAPDEVSICDLDAMRTIYSAKETYLKTPFYRRLTSSPIESIFSTSNVEYHRRYRRLLAGPLSETSLKLWTQRVHQQMSLVADKMQQEMDSRGAADVYKWWFFTATDIIGELTFGDSFGM